jgi:23S rRNA (uracil1939-C5)-methyltransferase
MDKQSASALAQQEPQPPQEAVLFVEAFDTHGTARARFKNRWIEVEHGIPGETVRALVHGRRRMWAKIIEVINPAPERVAAPCSYFHQGCGGCQWQMIAYQSQVARKRAQIDTEMAAAGLSLRVSEMYEMSEPWRYRYTAGISLGRQAGFRRHGSQSIVGLNDCLISHPLIGALMAHLNHAIDAGTIPNYRGQVTLDTQISGKPGAESLHVAIRPTPGADLDFHVDIMPLADVLAAFEPVVGVCYRRGEESLQQLRGEPFATLEVIDRSFVVTAATFFQTNMALLPHLIKRLVESAHPTANDVVVDVYGGIGLFGLFLAPHVGRVIEIELDPVAVEAAQRSAALQRLDNVEFLTGTAETLLARVGQADTIIVDPPRTGLSPKVIAAIQRCQPRRILYVSCLARSLARDITDLVAAGYRPTHLDAFDFYPQTYHVELFTVLQNERFVRINK